MDHQLSEESLLDFEEAIAVINSTTLKTHEENEMAVHGDQKVWKKSDKYIDQIKEVLLECKYQTIVDAKDEIEEENKIQSTIVCEPDQPLPSPPRAINIQGKKVAIPKLNIKTVKKPRRRMGRRPRPIVPIIRPIAPKSTLHLDQALTQHRIIIPSPQMTEGTYQIVLGNNGQNSNNPVQYTILQPQPVFLNSVLTPTSTASSMVISQPYQLTQSQVSSSTKILAITPDIFGETYCSYCYKLVNNIKEHVEVCWANQNNKSY